MRDLPPLPPPGSSQETKDEWIDNFEMNYMDQWHPHSQDNMDKKIYQNILRICPDYAAFLDSEDDFYTCDYRLSFQEISKDVNSHMDDLHEKLTSEGVIYTCDFEYHFAEDQNGDLRWSPSQMEFYGPSIDTESPDELKNALFKSIKMLFSLAQEIGVEPLYPQEIELSGSVLTLNLDGSYEFSEQPPSKLRAFIINEDGEKIEIDPRFIFKDSED